MRRPAELLLRAAAFVSVLGIAGLGVMVLVGFEEPNTALLGSSVAAVLSAPLAVVVHLAFAGDLTAHERAAWCRLLTGPRSIAAWPEYIQSSDRRRSLAVLLAAPAPAAPGP